jgi:hypothetical protein
MPMIRELLPDYGFEPSYTQFVENRNAFVKYLSFRMPADSSFHRHSSRIIKLPFLIEYIFGDPKMITEAKKFALTFADSAVAIENRYAVKRLTTEVTFAVLNFGNSENSRTGILAILDHIHKESL